MLYNSNYGLNKVVWQVKKCFCGFRSNFASATCVCSMYCISSSCLSAYMHWAHSKELNFIITVVVLQKWITSKTKALWCSCVKPHAAISTTSANMLFFDYNFNILYCHFLWSWPQTQKTRQTSSYVCVCVWDNNIKMYMSVAV